MFHLKAETSKPTWLYSSKAFIKDIANHKLRIWEDHREFAPTLVSTKRDFDGNLRVTGNEHLKMSQALFCL